MKLKQKLIQDYLLISDDLSRTAAYAEGLEQGMKLSCKRRRKLHSALRELLGLGEKDEQQAKVFALKVLNYNG